MKIFDIIHGYQPFTKDCMEKWVIENLKETFLPTSISMKNKAHAQNVQLQGWTIDEWLNNPSSKPIAKKVINNLKTAFKNNTITMGCSTYAHALLPLLSNSLAYAFIYIDYNTIKEKIGPSTFFFPPELAIDKKKLKLLFDHFPKLIPIIPNISINSKKSEFILVEYKKKGYLCCSSNIFLKDTLMNGTVYQNINYLPKNLPKKHAQLSMRNPNFFISTLNKLDKTKTHIIPRDWENGESKTALKKTPKGKIITGFQNNLGNFQLLNKNIEPTIIININKIRKSCWEPKSTPKNPYPYWIQPKRKITKYWLSILDIYEKAFEKHFQLEALSEENKIKKIHFALQQEKNIKFLKETSPALISCIPWHFLSREEWDSDIGYAKKMLQKIVIPKLKEIVKASGLKGQIEKINKIEKDMLNI